MRWIIKMIAMTTLVAGGAALVNKLVNSAYRATAERYVTFDDEDCNTVFATEGSYTQRDE